MSLLSILKLSTRTKLSESGEYWRKLGHQSKAIIRCKTNRQVGVWSNTSVHRASAFNGSAPCLAWGRHKSCSSLVSDCLRSSEYTSRYVPQRPAPKRLDIPRIYSTAIGRTQSLNENYYSPFTSRREVTEHDTTSTDHLTSLRRNSHVPRSYFYLGQVPDSVDDRVQEKLPPLTASVNMNQPVTSSSFEQHPTAESTDWKD